MKARKRRGLVHWAIAHPVGSITISLSVCMVGLALGSNLAVDLLPKIIYPQVRASVTYQGVDPEVIEQTVTKPLETRLATTENAILLTSESSEGRSSVDVHFSYGTDVDFALRDASTKLDQAKAALPREVDPPVIFKFDPSQIPVLQFAVSSPTRDAAWLKRWCEDFLARQLLTVEGVASVDVAGGLDREIQVIVDPERLRFYGLTLSQVLNRLQEENLDISGGRIMTATREVLTKTKGKFRSVEDIRAVRLPLRDGAGIALTDVAQVLDTYRDNRVYVRLNGEAAVQVAVSKQPDANTVKVVTGCTRVLDRLEREGFFPPDVTFKVVEDQAFYVKAAVSGVGQAALLGGALAMSVVFLFLRSFRRTLIIGAAIPLAILGCLALMGVSGMTLNLMSLGGLALGIGMLVDNAIVMLENIDRHQRKGEDPLEATHEGAGEVASAVVASTLTNLAAVVPFLLISGLAALIFRELLLTISFAILTSLLVALTLVPMLSGQLFRLKERRSPLAQLTLLNIIPELVERLEGIYRRQLAWVLRHRGRVLLLALAIFALSLWGMGRLGSEFLPPVDDGRVRVFFRFPPDVSVETTNRAVAEAEKLVQSLPEVRQVFAVAGGGIFGRGVSVNPAVGSLVVELTPRRSRGMSAGEWVRLAQGRLQALPAMKDARVRISPPRIRGLRTSASTEDIEVKIFGDDLKTLERLGNDLAAQLAGLPGLVNVDSSYQRTAPELRIEVDRLRASTIGLDVGEVGRTVRAAVAGVVATRLTEGDREFDVRVRFPRELLASAAEVGSIPLFLSSGLPVRIRDVAKVFEGEAPQTILRENQNRLVRVTAQALTGVWSVGQATQEVKKLLQKLQLPAGYRVRLGGQVETTEENRRIFLTMLFLAIFLVFAVMAVQYESFVLPFSIIGAIPMALVGVVVALWLAGLPISAPVMLGMILLAGIVVNNGILLVEYIELRHRAGAADRLAAVLEAAPLRVRPILMTVSTTVVGMLPLALNPAEGAELMRPLAVAVIGGLTLSTALTLFLVPILYLMLTSWRDVSAKRLLRS